MLGEFLTLTKLAETAFKWMSGLYRIIRPVKPERSPTVTSRFVALFEMHGVHKNQIPSFFRNGITLADIANEEKLLDKLTDTVIDAASSLFGTRKEWLLCVDDNLFDTQHFYKQLEKAKAFVNSLAAEHEWVRATLMLDANHGIGTSDVLVFHVPIGEVDGLVIYRNIVIDEYSHRYWKSMAYLVAVVAMADKAGIYVDGYLVELKHYTGLVNREVTFNKSMVPSGSVYFNPEDLANDPNFYTQWIDPESNNFGMKSALALFLKFANDGYMATSEGEPPIELFKEKLRAVR